MQQPCSNAATGGGKLNDERHREEIRRLVAAAPDEPTYCEFKRTLAYATPKEKAELVKDVSSFANADLKAVGGFGYIVFGVSDGGRVVGIPNADGDPSSTSRQIVNGHLGRAVDFDYLTCEVDDAAGGIKRVAAVVVPDSRRRPHVVAREITERVGGKHKFWLRKGEVWVRKTGGRELASADDFDTIYEGKLQRLIDESVRPLHQRVEELQQALREQRSLVPEISFGFATSSSRELSRQGEPYPVLGNLIDVDGVGDEIQWANSKSRDARVAASIRQLPSFDRGEPGAESYTEYARKLRDWYIELNDLYFVDFALVNTGRTPAEDVEVVLEVPAELRPKAGWLEWPGRPQDYRFAHFNQFTRDTPSFVMAKPTPADPLDEPDVYVATGSDITEVRWTVDKLYHGRPLFTQSIGDDVSGLLISAKGHEDLLSKTDGGIRLVYVVRAANLPEAHRGVVFLV